VLDRVSLIAAVRLRQTGQVSRLQGGVSGRDDPGGRRPADRVEDPGDPGARVVPGTDGCGRRTVVAVEDHAGVGGRQGGVRPGVALVARQPVVGVALEDRVGDAVPHGADADPAHRLDLGHAGGHVRPQQILGVEAAVAVVQLDRGDACVVAQGRAVALAGAALHRPGPHVRGDVGPYVGSPDRGHADLAEGRVADGEDGSGGCGGEVDLDDDLRHRHQNTFWPWMRSSPPLCRYAPMESTTWRPISRGCEPTGACTVRLMVVTPPPPAPEAGCQFGTTRSGM
jgi:hypothetical protein